MAEVRTPPVWLVVLPALALAAAGARAVVAEIDAAQDAARERARSVAARLARSVDALVEEYAAPLPPSGSGVTREEARAATAHLESPGAVSASGRSLAVARDLPADPGAPPAEETALVEDALAAADRLGQEAAPDAAAAFLRAAAGAVRHPAARARLFLAAAETSDGDARDEAVLETIQAGASLRDEDGAPFDVRALRLAGPRVFDHRSVREAYARVAEDPWGLPDDVRDGALRAAEASLPSADLAALRRPWDVLRSHARALGRGEPPPRAALLSTDSRALLVVATDVVLDGERAVLGGAVPAATRIARLLEETRALAEEPGVASAGLAGPGGARAFDAGAGAGPGRVEIESVPLASPLDAWRAEAAVRPDSGVPATAWLLGAAVAAATAAMLAAAFALRRAAARSARLAAERKTFLDHVAHELRSPAAALQALAEELAAGHVAPERETLYRGHLVREARRLSALVADTLDLARLDAGRLAFRREPADLRDVVRRAVEESEGAGRVVASLPDEAVVREVDEGALRRAVRNLVENAVRHGGGDAPVRVTLEAPNGLASIRVEDQGRGIAAEHLPRLFERFYRVPSPTHESKGVGLGLALCREVARAHGGDVTAASEPGRGSTFTITVGGPPPEETDAQR